MLPSKYSLRFPCPRCGKSLTMPKPEAEGCCPSCQCVLTVSLHVEEKKADAVEKKEPTLAWEKRAFRRNTASTQSS